MHPTALVSLLLLPTVLGASLLPFGPGAGDVGIDPSDVASEHTLSSGEFVFFGKNYKELHIHIDGVIGLGTPPAYYGPYSFPLSGYTMIAPFWAGADTSLYNEPAVFYRETIDPTLILEVKNYIDGYYGVSFTPAGLFIATWDNIGYQNKHIDKFNTFQLVLAFNQQESYVLFLYDDIQWTTADRSGGENGLGGTPATVGLNSGDGVHYLIVQGSGSSEIADVEHATNVGMDGLFIFRTDTDIVAPAPFALYPFGGQLDTNLASGDAVLSSTTLGVPVVFYGQSHSAVEVATDGYILLGSGLSLSSTPQNFPLANNIPMIAAFWANADTQGAGAVYYRETSNSSLLKKAEREIGLSYGGNFSPTSLFIVTWDRVGYSSGHTDKRNTFQAVIASDGSQSYILFLYGDLQWSTGDSDGGSGGTGGAAAVAGINAGDGENYFLLPGSGAASVLNLDSDSNIAVDGQFVLSGGHAKLYTYGYGLDNRYITNSNDGSLFLSSYSFPESFVFGGTAYNNVKVYVNGYITVGGSGGSICPQAFPTSGIGIVAPFWSDVDTRNGAGIVFARVTTDICVLSRARTDMRASTGNSAFSPDWLLVVTWNDVGYESMHADKTNTFQAVLASDGVNTHVLYLYEKLQWTTGDHCGNPAVAGINMGDGTHSVSLPGSGSSAVLGYTSTSNVGVPGLFIMPYVSANPETPARMMSYYANTRPQPIQYRGPLFAQASSAPAQPHNRAYKGLNNRVTIAALLSGPPHFQNTDEKGRLAPGYAARLQNMGYVTYQSLNDPRRPIRPVPGQYMEPAVAQGFPNTPVIGPKIASQMNARFMGPLNLANGK